MMLFNLAMSSTDQNITGLAQQWANIHSKKIHKEVAAFINTLQTNTTCCHSSNTPSLETPFPHHKKQILICMSYSVPISVWKNLWQEAKTLKQSIQFVIRGLPDNSFQELAKKVLEYGCPVIIDPTLFERHNITQVPAFLTEKRGFYGNVTLNYVLNHITEQEVKP